MDVQPEEPARVRPPADPVDGKRGRGPGACGPVVEHVEGLVEEGPSEEHLEDERADRDQVGALARRRRPRGVEHQDERAAPGSRRLPAGVDDDEAADAVERGPGPGLVGGLGHGRILPSVALRSWLQRLTQHDRELVVLQHDRVGPHRASAGAGDDRGDRRLVETEGPERRDQPAVHARSVATRMSRAWAPDAGGRPASYRPRSAYLGSAGEAGVRSSAATFAAVTPASIAPHATPCGIGRRAPSGDASPWTAPRPRSRGRSRRGGMRGPSGPDGGRIRAVRVRVPGEEPVAGSLEPGKGERIGHRPARDET